MPVLSRTFVFVFRLSVFLFLLSFVPLINAQEANTTTPAADNREANMVERVRQLETELERQNAKLDQLQKTLADQSAAIHELLEKLASNKTEQPKVAATATANIQNQPPTVEQRLAKVEGQALKIGPVKVSGDFRLRWDGTFRSATTPPDPPLEHVQNSRGRYRLRINFDTDLYPTLNFHAQLATGPLNSPLSTNQDFTSLTARPLLSLQEAWIEYRPTKSLQLQGGRVQEVFADNSRFLFDDDVRFHGFNEKYVANFGANAAYLKSLEFRAGQYILSNPTIAIIAPNSPLARAGEVVGSTARSATMFHQGFLANQTFNERWSSQTGADLQIYRHPNQIQLGSTTDGVVLLVQPGLGVALSGPLSGTGNATTTPGGVVYTAPGFQIARITYRLNYAGFTRGDHAYPITFNAQVARNVATGLNERDAMLTAFQVGRVTKRNDTSYLYVFTIKGANSLISQVTDDDLGTGSGVNIRTHHFRFEYGISKKVTFQSLFFVQHSLRRSGQYPNFFVPVSSFAPTTYRLQQQVVFSF
jgi:hypothetical protein